LGNRVEIIAHRGASHAAPENTLASVSLAWQMEADAVEVDVHLSKDNRIVAIHDPWTDRTGGVRLEVANTIARHLRRLDVGSHKHHQYARERIPFLEEVLDTVPPGRRLFIEVKCGPDILPFLDEAVTRSGKRSQVSIIGFSLDAMKTAKQVVPDVPIYWLRDTSFRAPYGLSLVGETRQANLDGLDVRWTGLTLPFARAVKDAGLKLYVWTVDNLGPAMFVRSLGVDGITTNRPGWLRRRMAAPPRPPGTASGQSL